MNAHQMRISQLEAEVADLRRSLEAESALSYRLASGLIAVRRALGIEAREVVECPMYDCHDPPLRYRAVEPIRAISDEEVHETVEAARACVGQLRGRGPGGRR